MDIDQSISIKEQATQDIANYNHTDVTDAAVTIHNDGIDYTESSSHHGNLYNSPNT